MNGLLQSIVENVMFLLVFLLVIIAVFAIAYGMEKWAQKRTGVKERILTTNKITMIGVFSAIAAILHILDFPVPFAPGFYKLDGSELPALLGTFALGPVAGVMIEICKIILKLLFKGTSTAFVGDLANFVIACSFLLPASFFYLLKKSKVHAVFGCIAGTLSMTIFGTAFNAIYLLPAFAKLYGMPLEAIIEAGNAINANIHNVTSFVIFAVAPLNLLKGTAVSVLTLLVYKPLSPFIKHSFDKIQR